MPTNLTRLPDPASSPAATIRPRPGDEPISPARGRPSRACGASVAVAWNVCISTRARLDLLIAVGLASVLLLQIWLGDQIGGTAVDVVGGLLLTLPLAVRRRAPLAVAVVFAPAAALDAILGGPPRRALRRRAAAVRAARSRARSRSTRSAPTRATGGRWSAPASASPGCGPRCCANGPDAQSFLFSAGLIVAAPWLVGRSVRARALSCRARAAPARARRRGRGARADRARAARRRRAQRRRRWSCRPRAPGACSTATPSAPARRWSDRAHGAARRWTRCAARSACCGAPTRRAAGARSRA